MSQPKGNNGQIPTTEESAVEAALHRVLTATGRIVPQTEEEVAQAEVMVDEESVELPARLLTPPTRQQPIRTPPTRGPMDTPCTVAAQNLARAARQGTDIPQEVAERMECDRMKAEQQTESDA